MQRFKNIYYLKKDHLKAATYIPRHWGTDKICIAEADDAASRQSATLH